MSSANIKILAKYLLNHKIEILFVLISLSITALSTLFIGYIFKLLIDVGLKNNDIATLNYSMTLLIGLIFIFASASACRAYFINLIAEKVTSKIKLDTYTNLLNTDIAIFEELKIGEIITNLSTDIDNISQLINNFLSFIIRNSIMLIGGFSLMFLQSPKLSSLVIITLPIILSPLLILSKKVRSLSRSVAKHKSNITSSIEESFTGIREITSYNRQKYMSNNFNDQVSAYLEISQNRLKLRSIFFGLAIISIAITISSVIWIGSLDILSGIISSGGMISFIYYAILVGLSAGGIAESFSEVQGPLVSLDRVLLLNSTHQKSLANNNINSLAKFNTHEPINIEFQKVSFSYPARANIEILEDLSFNINHGEFTAIAGKSGSGKSTIMQLIMQFYTNYHGSIQIGNQNITNIEPKSIREKIAYVQQDPIIFSGTIRSNILFSNKNASNIDINQVVEICGITEFVANLDQGLDTEIGEKGIRLSGGQKQRIAIARALLYKADLLMLDEATSALDSESETKILYNIKNIFSDKTIISITHRMSASQNADQIILIHKGSFVANGTHQELLKTSDLYNLLYKEQMML